MKAEGWNDETLDIIKELFYASRKTLYELFKEVSPQDRLDFSGFSRLVSKYSNQVITDEMAKEAFDQVCKRFSSASEMYKKDFLKWQEFEKAFTLLVPDPQKFEDETRVILAVKNWMAKRRYTASQAFDKLLISVKRTAERSLRRYDFHKALVDNEVLLTSPEIDFLFDVLTGFKSL